MVKPDRSRYAGHLRVYANVISAIVIATLSVNLSIIFLPEYPTQAQGYTPTDIESIATRACDMNGTVTTIAAMQGWHGQINHLLPPPYDSADSEVIAKQVALAEALCITALALDWYGPEANLPNDLDRAHIDLVFKNMLSQAQANVQVVLMYDENSITQAKRISTTEMINQQVLSDLLYAETQGYFSHTNYWKIDNQPVLFIFPYREIDAQIDWSYILTQLNTNVKLITMWGEDLDYSHYIDEIDGFYGWVQIENPSSYLDKFYTTMSQTYPDKLAFGGVWPGFDDTLADWGTGRYLSRACGQTWLDTWTKVEEHKPPFTLISTLNDYEEGTDIEQGIVKLVTSNDGPILPGDTVTLTAFMADCPDVTYTWNFGDGNCDTGIDIINHTYPEPGTYWATITAEYMPIDVTDNSTEILKATTLVRVSSIGWQEDFNPLDTDQWIQPSAIWTYTKGPTATLTENNPNPNETSGKAETIPLTINMTRYPFLRVKVTDVEDGAKFTIQILDKTITETDAATNVITDETEPGEYPPVDLAKVLGWTGQQKFTINLWVIGEGKNVTFEYLSIGNKSSSAPPPDVFTKTYLPIISSNLTPCSPSGK